MLKEHSKAEQISDILVRERHSSLATIRGWIHRKRESGAKIFFVLRDSTGIIQCVVDKSLVSDSEWEEIKKAHLESSIIVKGQIREDKRAPGGAEISVEELEVIHSGEQFPIGKYQSPELLLDTRHLWIRSRRMTRIMTIRAHMFSYAREFLDKRRFLEVSPPLITTIGGETGADLFEINYFGKKAYLTESSQLYLEAMITSLERVYSLAPSYRAEKSRTIKHLAEYWHLEVEAAYMNNESNMKLQESLISNIVKRLVKDDANILKELEVDLDQLKKIVPPFKKITYDRAIEILKNSGSDRKWGDDFGVEEERLLTEKEDKPIFIYNWPKGIKAFYMTNPKDSRTVICSDMLAPRGHGEIIGGSERIWKMEDLLKRMREKRLKIENYKWYVDLRRYGSVPHAGFGMGMERVIKWVLNLDHIRDAIPFPRVINRVIP